MRYMGSKKRAAKKLAPILAELGKDCQVYCEPFMGALGLGKYIALKDRMIFNDSNENLKILYDAIKNGWRPPDDLMEKDVWREDYYRIKADKSDMPLWVLVGYSCSVGGKWWGGHKISSRQPEGISQNGTNIIAGFKHLEAVIGRIGEVSEFMDNDYRDLKFDQKTLIYCDPPYEGVTGYGVKFDHKAFWSWCDTMLGDGHIVAVSEFNAPTGWKSVWSKSMDVHLGGAGETHLYKTDQLFIREDSHV